MKATMAYALHPRDPVMLVDDEVLALESLEILLRTEGITNVIKVSDARLVLNKLKSGPVSAVLLDLIMPHLSGEKLLAEITREFPDVPVVVVTGNNSLENAVQCMKKGAFDFMLKPVDGERVITCLRHAVGLAELRAENRQLRERLFAAGTLTHPEHFAALVTASPGMLAVFQYIEAVAGSSQPVLITGETGVGKELVARAVHQASGRSGRFVAVNVAGLDDQLFTDTLFGHTRGAFTGAAAHREGLIACAGDGTLFLDEIGDLSQASQLKLLRLLQEAEYLTMGSDEIRRTTARIVVATNQDLATLQAAGRFRKDLYYRLATHEINVPPLRNRREDIPLLARHFLRELARETGCAPAEQSAELLGLLDQYDFPGNVRELQALLHDAVRQSAPGGGLDVGLLRRKLRRRSAGTPAQGRDPARALMSGAAPVGDLPTLRAMADALVDEALLRAGGRQAPAAQMLGISQQALSKRLARRR